MNKYVVISAIGMFANFLDFVILLRVLFSWIGGGYKNNIIIKLVYDFTEPILKPIRNAINKSPLGGPGMILDFSPIIAAAFIHVITNGIINLLSQI